MAAIPYNDEQILEPQKNPQLELRPPQMRDPAQRKELATTICKWIQLGQGQQGDLNKRWLKNKQIYQGQPDTEMGIKVTEDSEPLTFNIVKPRVNTLVTKVCQPLTSQRPFFSAMGYRGDRNRLKENEDVVQFCYERADYDKKLRKATREACMAAPMYWRCAFHVQMDDELADAPEEMADLDRPFRYCGPKLDLFHPNDVVIYPLVSGGIEAARLVGTRTTMRLRDIKELQLTGKFFDSESIYGGDDPQTWQSGRDQQWSLTQEATGIDSKEDEHAEVWECIVKLDLEGTGLEKRYRIVVAMNSETLLECEFFGVKTEDGSLISYSRPWYFPHYIEEPGINETFCSNPPVQDLQPIQAVYSDLITLAVEATKFAAFPAGFIFGGGVDQKVIRYQPGEFHPVPNGVTIQNIEQNINIGAIPTLLNICKEDADANLRISQNATAQTQGKSATEAAILNANTDEGAEEYRDNVAVSGEKMADFIRELTYLHYDQMKDAYGDSFPCENRENLRSPLRWEATGKTSDTAPQVVASNFKDLLEILKDPQLTQDLGLNRKGVFKAWIKTKKLPIPDSDLFLNEGAEGGQVESGSIPQMAGNGPSGLVPPDAFNAIGGLGQTMPGAIPANPAGSPY